MKQCKQLNRHLVSGFTIAVGLSLAYLFFGSWDVLFWSPGPLWAKILFFPGVAVGHFCWNQKSDSEVVCRVVGVGTMGIVGGIIGLALHGVIRKQQGREIENETGGL